MMQDNHLPTTLLKLTIFAMSGYFMLVTAAHFTGAKFPLIYIYFNVPSEVYQDKIISFLALGWAMLFLTTAQDVVRNIKFVRAILIAGSGAVLMLCHINYSTDFAALDVNAMNNTFTIQPQLFWIETAIMAVIVGWIFVLYLMVQKQHSTG